MENAHTHSTAKEDVEANGIPWETSNGKFGGKLSGKFSGRRRRIGMPTLPTLPDRLCGIRKKIYLPVAWVLLLVLILIIGLAAGLAAKHNKPQNLPLPGNSEQHTGDLTYYGPGLGACGITSTDADHIVAVSHIVFDAVQKGKNPNANPLCGKIIRARHTTTSGQSRTRDLTVVDRCTGCKPNDLDVTQPSFNYLAPDGNGRTNVTWAWLE